MQKSKYPVFNIGTSSILTIFVILSMVAFSTLSLLSAHKDLDFTEQIARSNTAYYEASNAAMTKISQIDKELLSSYENGAFDTVEPKITFSVPIDKDHILSVELTTHAPTEENPSFYQITRFQKALTKEWEGEDFLDLMQIK